MQKAPKTLLAVHAGLLLLLHVNSIHPSTSKQWLSQSFVVYQACITTTTAANLYDMLKGVFRQVPSEIAKNCDIFLS